MLPFCEDDLPREVCQAQVRNITCFMHKQLPGESKMTIKYRLYTSRFTRYTARSP